MMRRRYEMFLVLRSLGIPFWAAYLAVIQDTRPRGRRLLSKRTQRNTPARGKTE